jgi:hypothetical protein
MIEKMRCLGSAFFFARRRAGGDAGLGLRDLTFGENLSFGEYLLRAGSCTMKMTHLRQHTAGQFFSLVAGRVVAQDFRCETADYFAGLLRCVMLRQGRAGQFFLLKGRGYAPQDERREMGETIRRFCMVTGIQRDSIVFISKLGGRRFFSRDRFQLIMVN